MDKLFANRVRGWIEWGWATLEGGLLFAIRTDLGFQSAHSGVSESEFTDGAGTSSRRLPPSRRGSTLSSSAGPLPPSSRPKPLSGRGRRGTRGGLLSSSGGTGKGTGGTSTTSTGGSSSHPLRNFFSTTTARYARYKKNIESERWEQRTKTDEIIFQELLKVSRRWSSSSAGGGSTGGYQHGGTGYEDHDETLLWQFVFGYAGERDRKRTTVVQFEKSLEARAKLLGVLVRGGGGGGSPAAASEMGQIGGEAVSSAWSRSPRAGGDVSGSIGGASSPAKELGLRTTRTSAELPVMRRSDAERVPYPVYHLGYDTIYGYPIVWHYLSLDCIK